MDISWSADTLSEDYQEAIKQACLSGQRLHQSEKYKRQTDIPWLLLFLPPARFKTLTCVKGSLTKQTWLYKNHCSIQTESVLGQMFIQFHNKFPLQYQLIEVHYIIVFHKIVERGPPFQNLSSFIYGPHHFHSEVQWTGDTWFASQR